MKNSRVAILGAGTIGMALAVAMSNVGVRAVIDEGSHFPPRRKRDEPVTATAEGLERIRKAEAKRARKAQIRANGGKK